MKEELMNDILHKMSPQLSDEQMQTLKMVLYVALHDVEVVKQTTDIIKYDNSIRKLIELFLNTLTVENKSIETIKQYRLHLSQLADFLQGKSITEVNVFDLRYFLAKYKEERKISNTSLNHKRSVISSFFTWLTDEEYILKNPARKLKKIKEKKKVKKAFSQKELELLRNECGSERERAIVEVLISTGCRVSEIVKANIGDIDFQTGEVKVTGKGDKERVVYLDEKALMYLNLYLDSRGDNNVALFVSKKQPFMRLQKDGIERIISNLGKRASVKAHPHKFRRTLCTNLINRGMPAQDVAILLGHEDVNITCSIYYKANNDNIRYQFKKYST
nr:MAG TPA: SITE SPECIFIC RECOMBINASE XERD [Caudoviricetes sp.]